MHCCFYLFSCFYCISLCWFRWYQQETPYCMGQVRFFSQFLTLDHTRSELQVETGRPIMARERRDIFVCWLCTEILRNSEFPLALAGHGQDRHIPTPATPASTGNFSMFGAAFLKICHSRPSKAASRKEDKGAPWHPHPVTSVQRMSSTRHTF